MSELNSRFYFILFYFIYFVPSKIINSSLNGVILQILILSDLVPH
jgi:hypothetical protein